MAAVICIALFLGGFAFPPLWLGLAGYVIYILVKIFSLGDKNEIIDKAIDHLAKQGSIMGTAYREISYMDVIKYIEKNNCEILNITKKERGDWIEFKTNINGEIYTVWLDKALEGNGSVLTAKKSN